MRKILNDTGIITIIALIGLMIGITYQHYLVVKDFVEVHQKLNALLDQEGDTVCRVVYMNGNYYFVCDETVMGSTNL